MVWIAGWAWAEWVVAAVGMVGFWGVVFLAVTDIVVDARAGGGDTKNLTLDTLGPGVAPAGIVRVARPGRTMTAPVR